MLIRWIVIYPVDSAIHRINHYPVDNTVGFANFYPVDSAVHRINHYPVDNTVGFANTYPVDSDLSGE